MTLRVAITGVSGDVGRGAILGLQANPADAEPVWNFGLDAISDFPSKRFLDCFVRLPLVKESGYVDALSAALEAHKIDVLLAGINSEISLLSAARHRLPTTTKVPLAPSKLVEAADDKLLTAEFSVVVRHWGAGDLSCRGACRHRSSCRCETTSRTWQPGRYSLVRSGSTTSLSRDATAKLLSSALYRGPRNHRGLPL